MSVTRRPLTVMHFRAAQRARACLHPSLSRERRWYEVTLSRLVQSTCRFEQSSSLTVRYLKEVFALDDLKMSELLCLLVREHLQKKERGGWWYHQSVDGETEDWQLYIIMIDTHYLSSHRNALHSQGPMLLARIIYTSTRK